MIRALPFAALLLTACTAPGTGPEPSLALRPAEAIDPRLPVTGSETAGPVDPALAAQLGQLVAGVRSASADFNAKEAVAGRLAVTAGPMASESWIAAEQALSRLIEQYGVTTAAAADVDALAAGRLASRRWISTPDREALAAAAAEIEAVSNSQAGAIDRIRSQLAR
jgi:hypothetical protein